MTKSRVLVIATDEAARSGPCRALAGAGYEPLGVATVADAAQATGAEGVALALVHAPSVGDWAALRRRTGAPPVVVMDPDGGAAQAVRALRSGAVDFLTEPDDPDQIRDAVRQHAVEPRSADPVARDPRTRQVLDLAARVADKPVTVLLHGESGTGKEVFARFLHARSGRRAGPFVAVNCAALPENMLEALLFGYEKGAFTGATRSHAGKFEQAGGGTLLLDEISEIPVELQAKLLRVLQEREVERLCGSAPIPVDVRVIATTNRDLRQAVAEGRFREDLYYRLCVFPIALPTLRERRDDILPLAERALRGLGLGHATLAPAARRALLDHDWPGNVRELENVMQRAAVLAEDGRIGPEELVFEAAPVAVAPADAGDGSLDESLRDREYRLIIDTLRQTAGSRKDAAEQLGISVRTLRYKLARMRDAGMDIPDSGALVQTG